jgi:hypothetical protein
MRRWINVMIAATVLTVAGSAAGTAAQAAPIAPSSNPNSNTASDKALNTVSNEASAAAGAAGDSGWVPVPVPPFERAAGVVCDFAVRGEPIVADLHKRTLQTNPDGSVRSELWVGPLVYRVTNESTGAQTQLDGSSTGVIVYNADGSSTWYLHGPLGVAIAAGAGNLPRGLWQVDGPAYTLGISATGFKTLSLKHVTTENICNRLD